MYISIPGVANFKYQEFGKGKAILFCFHGYGFTGEQFKILEPSLGEKYTLVAFDLPFHGETVVLDEAWIAAGFKQRHFQELIEAYCAHAGIKRFSIASFSIGSKVALVIAYHFAARLDELYLFAADGVQANWLYRFATQNKLGNWLFKYNLDYPQTLFFIVNLVLKIRIIPKKLASFAIGNFDSLEKRQQVYRIWMSFKNLQVSTRELAEKLNKQEVYTRIYAGEKDQVIRIKPLKAFANNLKYKEFVNLPYGHLLLNYSAINNYIQ